MHHEVGVPGWDALVRMGADQWRVILGAPVVGLDARAREGIWVQAARFLAVLHAVRLREGLGAGC